jgi:hypothetical protein
MTKTGIFLLLLVSFTYGLKLNHDQGQEQLDYGTVTLKGDNGLYLRYCQDCVSPGVNAASLD